MPLVAAGALLLLWQAQVYTPVMAVWAARLGVELHLQMPQQTARRAARDSWKPRAQPLERAVLPEHLALLALLLLRVVCSDRAAAVVAEAQAGLVAQVVLEVEALAEAAVQAVAARTQQVLAGLVAMAGLWYWSFDHAAICSC